MQIRIYMPVMVRNMLLSWAVEQTQVTQINFRWYILKSAQIYNKNEKKHKLNFIVNTKIHKKIKFVDHIMAH